MIIKYKEIWSYKEEISDLYFSRFEATGEQIFCCKELSCVEPYLEFRLTNDGSSNVILIGAEDNYDMDIEYHIKFCPFCGERFVFDSVGKFEQIIKKIKRPEEFDNKIELKRINEDS